VRAIAGRFRNMSTEVKKEIQLEIAHVLFIDMVGYSKLLINEQRELLDTLNRVVPETEQFRIAEAAGKLIKIPTGDGMALVFYTSPEAPVRCATDLSRALKHHPRLRLRMGIHSGPVSGIVDVTGRANLAGAGLNMAHRVMSCGDAGHILLSKHVAEDLAEFEEWRPLLHELGACEVKHGAEVFIVNLYGNDAGNPEVPIAFQLMKQRRARHRSIAIAAALIAVGAIIAGVMWFSRARTTAPAPSAIPEKSIAVLPFENLSEEKGTAYFAEGIKDEILTKLATVRDLKVISRTSTAKYQSKPDNLKTVAQELGVSTILEGAVQKAGDKVRVNVQLIDARVDTHLWAKSYDRDFKDVLGVESEVSQEIAEALQANLSPSESHALASTRIHDAEAYDFFLRGEYEFHQADSSGAAEAFDRADAFYRQALARDPNFAEAAAELARSRLYRHWEISPLTATQLDEIKSIIDHALTLAPNLPEAHLALGLFFYWGHRQYEAALTEFSSTLELQPNNALARLYRASVYRRRGEWERSLTDFQRAEELDPRDPWNPTAIGQTYQAFRQWKDAERAELRALAIDPHHAPAALELLIARFNETGDVDSARRALDGFPEATEGIRTTGATGVGDVRAIIGTMVYLDVMERRFTDAFQALEKEVGNNDLGHLRQLAGRAALSVLAGEPEAAKFAGEEALPLLEARLMERPDDTFAMAELSWVYLALGRNTDALRLSRQAADSISIEKDAVSGPGFQSGLAEIEAHAGAPEEAIKRLRRLLSIPAGVVASIARLKIDPVWDPIRNRPDFQQLLSGPEQIGPKK
jgi:TolB-like protein/class 3 adenylate cyclase